MRIARAPHPDYRYAVGALRDCYVHWRLIDRALAPAEDFAQPPVVAPPQAVHARAHSRRAGF